MRTFRIHFTVTRSTTQFSPQTTFTGVSLAIFIAAAILGAGGCGLFGLGGGDENESGESQDIFAGGALKVIGDSAPRGSNSQFMARIADQLGWEQSLSRDKLLRTAVEEEEFNSKVEPYLITLFYRNGFSVLPHLGEGHQIARDTLVRGDVGANRYLVTTREQVRIIFLGTVRGVQLVYPRDGTEPLVFARDEKGTIAIRASLVKDDLR